MILYYNISVILTTVAMVILSRLHQGRLQLSSLKTTYYEPLPMTLPYMVNYQPRRVSMDTHCLYEYIDTSIMYDICPLITHMYPLSLSICPLYSTPHYVK